MELKAVPCCRCKQIPILKSEPGDLWYTYCGCSKWNKYTFLGTTRKESVRQWNEANVSSRKYTNIDKREK